MIWLVCINRNQGDSAPRMLAATSEFGTRRVLVLDRSPEIMGAGWPHVVRNDSGNGFLAGAMRDLGLARVRELDPDYTGVCFVDGDRIPLDPLLPDCRGDAVLFSVPDDKRGNPPFLADVTEACFDLIQSPFFSCAFYLSRRAIESVLEDGRLFAPCFDGEWGGEDQDLGHRIALAGFRIAASPVCVSGTLEDRFSQGANPRNFHIRKARFEKRRDSYIYHMSNSTIENALRTYSLSDSTLRGSFTLAMDSMHASVSVLRDSLVKLSEENAKLRSDLDSALASKAALESEIAELRASAIEDRR